MTFNNEGDISTDTYHNNENNEGDSNNNENINKTYKEDGNIKSNLKRKNNSHAQERLNLLKQIVNKKPSPQIELDETDLFFSSMAKIVKKLPRYEQAQIRMQIGALVGNAELRHISVDSPLISVSPRSGTSGSDYSETAIPSPVPTISINDQEQIAIPSPVPTISINDQGQIVLIPQDFNKYVQ